MPDASDNCACEPMIDPIARRILAASTVNVTQMVRIFLVLCFINGPDFYMGLQLFLKAAGAFMTGLISLVWATSVVA
jgi:hypothetical protein